VWLHGGSLVLTVILWHSIRHVTESGETAPGLGPFQVTSWEKVDEDQRLRDELESAEERVAEWGQDKPERD
jgi:hypothetical protein